MAGKYLNKIQEDMAMSTKYELNLNFHWFDQLNTKY
jgi:hypothetical protein